jgi:hypothetical protein
MLQRATFSLDPVPVRDLGRLRRDNEMWQLAANSLAAGVAVLDAQADIIGVNDASRRFAYSAGRGSDYVRANYKSHALAPMVQN